MSFDIPGYFKDLKTRKLYKITPNGPYSLPELRKRLQREAEEEAAAAVPTIKESRFRRPPTHFGDFLRQRSLHGSAGGISSTKFMLDQLKTKSTVYLEGPMSMYNNMLVETTSDSNEYGEMFVANRFGLQHFGYQIEPQFSTWKVGQELNTITDAQSMKLSNRKFEMDDQVYRPLLGTNGGTLWSRSYAVLPPLAQEEVEQIFMNSNGSIRQQDHVYECPASYQGLLYSVDSREFQGKKDLFWCSSFTDNLDTIVVGGDQKLYLLDISFNLLQHWSVKSSVFAAHVPKDCSDLCWIGLRNGKVQLVDWREGGMRYLWDKFRQSSSVYKIQTLDNMGSGHKVLTVAMDGAIDIWDIRQPVATKKNHNTKSTPVYSLAGHVNESSRHLGFDVDIENHLAMAAGSDGRVRIWSLDPSSVDSQPLWTSSKYAAAVPAAKFIMSPTQYPKMQPGWSLALPDDLLESRQCPGIMLFGTSKDSDQMRSIELLTSLK